MPILKYLGDSYDCATAIKGPDYIHLLDKNGVMVAAFDNITNFSGFTIENGGYTSPTADNNCYLTVTRDDGSFGKGDHKCSDISAALEAANNAAPALERAKFLQGPAASVSSKGWYRIATMYTLDSALICIGNPYKSGGPSRLLFYVYPNNTKSGIVVLSNTVPNANIITQIRAVYISDSVYGIDAYYNHTSANTMYASAVAFSASGTSSMAMGKWTAATDGTVLCTVPVSDMPSGSVLTSGHTYKDLGLFPRFKALQTASDNLNDFKDDGVIVYNTGSDWNKVPGNAPFLNASVGLCFGSDSSTNQRIQLVSRYGASGYLRVRGYSTAGEANPDGWLPWADLLTSANVVSSQTDITAGDAATDWQQYLVYE